MQRLTFGILGPVTVRIGTCPVPIGGPRAHAVLAALLLEPGRVVQLGRIVETAWGDEPPPGARFQAQNRVSGLRRALRGAGAEGVIITVNSGYLLREPAGGLDATEFDGRVRQARRHVTAGDLDEAAGALTAALALWRGEALAGLASRRLLAAARRLEEARLAARELLVEVELRRGRHHELVPDLLELTALHPWRERLVVQLMTALYRAGRRSDALATFERTRRKLAYELGTDPGPALVSLRDRILRDGPELNPAPPPDNGCQRVTGRRRA
jgi:DNA-binding SARP family transcriptional activator